MLLLMRLYKHASVSAYVHIDKRKNIETVLSSYVPEHA